MFVFGNGFLYIFDVCVSVHYCMDDDDSYKMGFFVTPADAIEYYCI